MKSFEQGCRASARTVGCRLAVAAVMVAATGGSLFAGPRTWCNPLTLPDMPIGHECRGYRHDTVLKPEMMAKWAYGCWQYRENGVKKARQFRELADPETLVEGNTWYLYPSCGLMWTSEDCGGTWKHVNIREQNEYAPAVAKFRGKYYYTDSYGPLCVADKPTGPFTELGRFKYGDFGDPEMASLGDPALFVDGDRLYLYWGCVSPSKALWGCELDPDNPLKPRTKAKRMVELDPVARPWMRSPLEGAYVFKRGDTYYFTHAGGSTGGYCFLVWKGKTPLGPFVPQKTNPAFVTPRGSAGCVMGTGHGSIFMDQFGDWWVNYCIWTGTPKFHDFERFIGQDRISFDENGDLVLGHGTGEPQWLPSSGKRGPTGWKAIKTTTAFKKAADDNLRTYAPFETDCGTMSFEFDGVKTLYAMRVIWCDLGLDELRGVVRGPWQYRVERRLNGVWQTWVDAADNAVDLTVDYRETAVEKADAVRITVLGGPKGITPALTEFTVFGTPVLD